MTEAQRQALKRARRIAAGVCTECAGPRATGDARYCERHRDLYRARARARRALDRKPTHDRRGQLHAVTSADVGQPVRPLVVCKTCCDQSWRRPVTGCPTCGGRYAPEDTRDAAELCVARRSVRPWE